MIAVSPLSLPAMPTDVAATVLLVLAVVFIAAGVVLWAVQAHEESHDD